MDFFSHKQLAIFHSESVKRIKTSPVALWTSVHLKYNVFVGKCQHVMDDSKKCDDILLQNSPLLNGNESVTSTVYMSFFIFIP